MALWWQTTTSTVAERLLARVLPAELYRHLCQHKWCVFDGKDGRKYYLRRGQKTIVVVKASEVDGRDPFGNGLRHYSACILFRGDYTQYPDQDRLVAEYLLIKNNERKYHNIAYLLEVYPWTPEGGFARYGS